MPKYGDFVLSRIDWCQVEARLRRYSYIAAHFPRGTLKATRPGPYFCHGLAWRLGTWKSERAFELFDELLGEGSAFPGWALRASSLTDPDFSSYWSSLWELQVASFLSARGLHPSWTESGPDLTVALSSGVGFVECYTYQKSFGVGDFIEEVLRQIHPRLRLDHRLFLQYSIPVGASRITFLEDLLSPLMQKETIQELDRASRLKYPVLLTVPVGMTGGSIVMDGDDPSVYDPAVKAAIGTTGDPHEYLQVALKEVLKAKQESNKLVASRPNLLAANLALSSDFQVATSLRRWPILSPSDPTAAYDAVMLATLGIDRKLEPSAYRMHLIPADGHAHPFDMLKSA